MAAIEEVEAGLGGPLSGEQVSAAMTICTSRRGAELVAGVVGAGKTTMFRVVSAAFEASGRSVCVFRKRVDQRRGARYRPSALLSMLAVNPPEPSIQSSKSPQVLKKSSVLRTTTVQFGHQR